MAHENTVIRWECHCYGQGLIQNKEIAQLKILDSRAIARFYKDAQLSILEKKVSIISRQTNKEKRQKKL